MDYYTQLMSRFVDNLVQVWPEEQDGCGRGGPDHGALRASCNIHIPYYSFIYTQS